VTGATLPHGAAEQDTVQLTPAFPPSLVTLAVNWAVAPTAKLADVGATETEIAVTATAPEADLVLSATEVAVTLTLRFAATELGAV
jgi:hypothetical protein